MLKNKIAQADIDFLENIIDNFTKEYGEIKNFVTPGETESSATLHLARTISRRAERHIVTLSQQDEVCPLLIKYTNRLSDVLFVTAVKLVYIDMIGSVKEKVQQRLTEQNYAKDFSHLWDEMAQAAFAESSRLGVLVSMAIADSSGNLLYFKRQDGAILVSINIAINKAYTSAYMKTDTASLHDVSSPGGSLFGINTVDPRLVIFGGGIPLIKNNVLYGAVGISGASVEDDISIANKAVTIFETR